MSTVIYTKKAIKGLRKMPKQYADSFRAAFERIGAKDETGLNIRPLQGRDGFRLRFGGFRAIYAFDGEQLNVLVLDAGPRGGIYQ